MFKHLLTIAAAACISLSASATVLWQSDTEEGVQVGWGQPCYAMSASDAVQAINAGDFLIMTVSGVTEGGWPQVALFPQYGGWPPLTNSGVGGQTYPYVVKFPVTEELYSTIKSDGISFSGDGAFVSKVEVESSGVEVNKFTVWFGTKECDWGNGVSVSASIFANIQPGAKLVFASSNESFQALLGGWDGLNIPAYDGSWANKTVTKEGDLTITTITMIPEYMETNTYGETTLNVFEAIKANGVVMHGTTTIKRIDYIPADYPAISAGGLTTYCPIDNNVIIPEGVTAYTVAVDGECAKLTAVDATILPKGCGVVLEGTAGTNFSLVATADDAAALDITNEMVGVTAATEDISGYVLGVKDGVCVFGKWAGGEFPAGKAYLNVAPVSGKPLQIVKDDNDTTGIESVTVDQADDTTYNVAGQQVNASFKGLVIKKGQKMYRK